MDNMTLWSTVKVTDPSAVKEIVGKAYKGNSPKPYWLIQRATEVFGPVGIGWGVTVKSERFERMTENDVLHVAVVSVWYVFDGKRAESFEQMGGTKAVYKTNKGIVIVDEDAGKKSVTDGMVKCLSMIGFAGDIFSGQWDDSKYVEFAAEETAKRTAPPIEYITADQCVELCDLAKELNLNTSAFFTWVSEKTKIDCDAFQKIPATAYEPIIKKLKSALLTKNKEIS